MLNTRIRFILATLLLLSIFLLNTNYTDADIFAEREVQNNYFSMSTIDFSSRHSANANNVNYVFKTLGLVPGGFDIGAVRIKKEGKLSFKYQLRATKTNGDDNLCQALKIQIIQRDLAQKYQGKLLDLNINSSLVNENPENWIFLVSLEDNKPELRSKLCEFNLTFQTWRSEPGEKGGIFAKRILSNVISSGNW